MIPNKTTTMQQPTGYGPPDLRLKFIHGTRFGGIKGYGIDYRIHHHRLVKKQGFDRYGTSIWDRGQGGRPIYGGKRKKRGRHHYRKRHHQHHSKKHHRHQHGSSSNSREINGNMGRLSHSSIKDIGPSESMWGPIGYKDRMHRNKHHQQSFGKMYGNFRHHDRRDQMRIALATPKTYVTSREFEGRFLGNVQRR